MLDELGAVMSEDMLRDSEALVDAQADLEHAFRGVKIKVGDELIPGAVELETLRALIARSRSK